MTREDFLHWATHFPEPLLLVSGEGSILAANPVTTALLWPAAVGLSGSTLFDFTGVDPEKVKGSLHLWSGCSEMTYGSFFLELNSGSQFRCQGAVVTPRTQETPAVLVVRLKPHEVTAGKFLTLNRKIEELSQEIRRRQASEERLREQREWLRVTLSSISDAVIATNTTGQIEFMNPMAEQLTGWDMREARGCPLESVFAICSELTRQRIPNPVELVLRTGAMAGLANHTILISRDGAERPIDDRAAPIRDSAGNLLGVVLVFQDISERKREEQVLEQRVAERTASLQEAVAELEAFSYTISHDLRAPLRSMQGYAEWVLQDYGEQIGAEGKECLRKIARASEHLDRLTLDILCYTRVSRSHVTMERVDLEELLRSILQEYPNFQPPTLHLKVASPLLRVRGNPALLTQCFSNLLANAIKFVAKGTAPEVNIWTEARDSQVRIAIQDNGIGIAPEDQKRIFRMFERIHPQRIYDGTGIGLSIVRKAVQRMGGCVGVESELGKGSTFWLQLPADVAASPPQLHANAAENGHVLDPSGLAPKTVAQIENGSYLSG